MVGICRLFVSVYKLSFNKSKIDANFRDFNLTGIISHSTLIVFRKH